MKSQPVFVCWRAGCRPERRQQDRNVNRADLYLFVRGNLLLTSALVVCTSLCAARDPPPASLLRNTGRVISS